MTEAFGKFDPVFNGSYTYSESFNPALVDATTGIRPATSFSKTDTADLNLGGVLPWGMAYQLGASTTFFVSQQQEILSNAEVREASAQSDYAKALADYDRQLGLTLEKLSITIEPPK